MDQVMFLKRAAITLHILGALFLSFLWKFASKQLKSCISFIIGRTNRVGVISQANCHPIAGILEKKNIIEKK